MIAGSIPNLVVNWVRRKLVLEKIQMANKIKLDL